MPRITRDLLILTVITSFMATLLWPVPLSASPQLINTIYLPIIIAPVRVDLLQLVSNNNCDTSFSNSVLSPATFAYGIKQLGVSTTVAGGIGQAWRLEWSKDGQRVPDLDKSGVIAQLPEQVAMTIVYGTNRQCGGTLPSGVYQVRLFLNDDLYQAATATIQ